jgi:hypothetical protein
MGIKVHASGVFSKPNPVFVLHDIILNTSFNLYHV